MEGLSGEGTRRRREYTKDTEVREPTVEDIERAKKQALERIDTSSESEMSAKEAADKIVQEILEEEKSEEEISRRVEDVIEELEKMKEFRESIERRKEEALERIDLQGKREKTDDSTEVRDDSNEFCFEEIRSQGEYDRTIKNHPELKLRMSYEKDERETLTYTENLERYLEPVKADTVGEAEILAKPESQEHVQDAPSKLQELDEEWVRNATSELDFREWTRESLTEQLSDISRSLPNTSRSFYIDLERYLSPSQKELDLFEQAFQQAKENFDEVDCVRLGLLGERLYVWKPDLESTGLENVYNDLYYYFRDRSAFERYVKDVGDSLGIQDRNQCEIQSYLKELSSQLVIDNVEDYCFNPKLRRIRGDYVNLMNDLSGKTLSDLEGDISKITGYNGHGGIENPRFPQGERLDVAIARIAATVFSDGTIEPNGVIKYAEPKMSRIERVVENVRVFGDITPSSTRREGEGHYITHLSFVLGRILMSRDVPSGDRTIQNPRLSQYIREGTDIVKRAYIEDFTPQDACVGEKSIIWRRVNALHAGEKTEKWKFEPMVGVEEIELIKELGRKSTGNAQSWSLSWGLLTELADHSGQKIAKISENLMQSIKNNQNRLMHDEASILGELGVNIGVNPSDVVYYPKSGRVSVVWQAYTVGIKETIKFGIVACPNDVNSKEKVREIIASNPKETQEALSDLRKRGIEFTKWWE